MPLDDFQSLSPPPIHPWPFGSREGKDPYLVRMWGHNGFAIDYELPLSLICLSPAGAAGIDQLLPAAQRPLLWEAQLEHQALNL